MSQRKEEEAALVCRKFCPRPVNFVTDHCACAPLCLKLTGPTAVLVNSSGISLALLHRALSPPCTTIEGLAIHVFRTVTGTNAKHPYCEPSRTRSV